MQVTTSKDDVWERLSQAESSGPLNLTVTSKRLNLKIQYRDKKNKQGKENTEEGLKAHF